jgi:hypothetical protein
MTDTCVHRSKAGCVCGDKVVAYIDGQALCVLHAQVVSAKKGKKRGRD